MPQFLPVALFLFHSTPRSDDMNSSPWCWGCSCCSICGCAVTPPVPAAPRSPLSCSFYMIICASATFENSPFPVFLSSSSWLTRSPLQVPSLPGQWGSQTERFLFTFLHVASPRHNQMPGICLHMPGRARLLTATVSSFNNHDMLHLLTPQHSHSGELYCQRHYPGTAEWLNSWGSIKGHFSYKSRAVGPVSHHTHTPCSAGRGATEAGPGNRGTFGVCVPCTPHGCGESGVHAKGAN